MNTGQQSLQFFNFPDFKILVFRSPLHFFKDNKEKSRQNTPSALLRLILISFVFNFVTVGSKVGEEIEEEQGIQVHQGHRVTGHQQRLTKQRCH